MPKHVHIHFHGAHVRQVTGDAGFNEADHKRDDDGKFTSGGGGGASPSDRPKKHLPLRHNPLPGEIGPDGRHYINPMSAPLRTVPDDDELVTMKMAGHGPEKQYAIPKPPPGVPGGPQPGRGPVDLGNQRGAKPFDHGELNIPGRTNNINAQLDAYKKQQEAQRKATAKTASAQLKEDKATAKALLGKHTEAIVKRHGAKFGEKELRNILDQWAKWEPKRAIAFVNKFLAEQAK